MIHWCTEGIVDNVSNIDMSNKIYSLFVENLTGCSSSDLFMYILQLFGHFYVKFTGYWIVYPLMEKA